MASYSPFHTLLQLVFAIISNSCCWCSGLEMFTGLSLVVLRASRTPNKWNLQPPPAQLNSKTKQSNGKRRPGRTGRESAKGHLSVSGGKAKPGCAGCRPQLSPGWSARVPWCHFPRELTDQAGCSKTQLAQIPRFLAHYLHFVLQMFICP